MPVESIWQVPEPLSVCEVRLDDGSISIVRRHGDPDAELRFVLSHGNGLAIDLYYPFWSLLCSNLDVVVYDLRNHGWNKVGLQTGHNIPTLVRDHDLILEDINRCYGYKPTVGVFHSLSALITLLSSSDRYTARVLFDPPLCKPGESQAELHAAAERAAALIRRRGNWFESENEFAEFLRYIPAFRGVVPGVLELMARTTLRKSATVPGYELRCPREYEAQFMEYSRSFFPLLDLGTVATPTKVIGADPTLDYSYLPTFDLSEITNLDYDFIPESTHYLQLEKPSECVTAMLEFLERHGLL